MSEFSPLETAIRLGVPKKVTVIGSGVTGVEFVHMFASFGAEVTLVVSRQHVLPGKDPEAAAILEDDFLSRGVRLLKGARATEIERPERPRQSRREMRRRPRRRINPRCACHRFGAKHRDAQP